MYSRSNVVGCAAHGIVLFIRPLELSGQTKVCNFLQHDNSDTLCYNSCYCIVNCYVLQLCTYGIHASGEQQVGETEVPV